MPFALKDLFYSGRDRHISHTIEYNCNIKQIVITAKIEVVQVKCSGTIGKQEINLFQLKACRMTSKESNICSEP